MTKTVPMSPQLFDEERIETKSENDLTDFRCEKCQGRYPYRLLVIQDGRRLCKPNCANTYSPTEVDNIVADAYIEAANLYSSTVLEAERRLGTAPNSSLMLNVSALTDITFTSPSTGSYPTPISLSPGGGGVTITGVGVNFQSTDTLAFSYTGITATTPSIATDQLSFTSTVAASGITPRGDYDLLFNGNIWRNAVRVR